MASATLQKACDVCAGEQIAFHAVFFGGTAAVVMEDVDHDVMQLFVHLLDVLQESISWLFWHISSPLVATPPALDALPGAYRTPACLECRHRIQANKAYWLPLLPAEHAVDNRASVHPPDQQLVLGCAGKSYITLNSPYTVLTVLLLMILCTGSCWLHTQSSLARSNFLHFA